MKEKSIQEYCQKILRILDLCDERYYKVCQFSLEEVDFYKKSAYSKQSSNVISSHENSDQYTSMIQSLKVRYALLKVTFVGLQIYPDIHQIYTENAFRFNSTKDWTEIQGIIPPISYEELYYALDFLNEDDIFMLLSTLPNSQKTQLLTAYNEKNKNKFIEFSQHIDSEGPCYAIYGFVTNTPKLKARVEEVFKEILTKDKEHCLQILSFMYPHLSEIISFNNQFYNKTKELADTEKIVEELIEKKKINELNVEQQTQLNTLEEKAFNQRNDIKKFEKELLQNCEMTLANFKSLISHDLKQTDNLEYQNQKAEKYLEPYKFIFEDVDSYEIDFDNKPETLIMAGIYAKALKLVLKTYKDENNRVEAVPTKEIAHTMDFNEVKNTDKASLGNSPFITSQICLLKVKEEDEDLVYHYSLEGLYRHLKTNNEIQCSKKEDFLYVLGDKMTEAVKTSDSPVINWIENSKNNMVAFFYKLYTTQDIKTTDIGRGKKKNCYSYNGKSIKLSENRKAAEGKEKEWENIIHRIVIDARREIEKQSHS